MIRWIGFLVGLCFLSTAIQAQERPIVDDILEKKILQERQVLAYPKIQENDILWEKRIWREIDTRQMMNAPFSYPEASLYSILTEAILAGEIKAYSPEDDKFTERMQADELSAQVHNSDTVQIMDPETYEITYVPVSNELDPEEIIKYRIKEVWYFDSHYGTLRVRILGIAPIYPVRDEYGNIRYEKPLYWVYYPHCRSLLARHRVFNPGNDGSLVSWEDHLEMRFFDSYVVKESNVHDRRIQDYLSGRDALLESERIEKEIFNYEHDLWSY